VPAEEAMTFIALQPRAIQAPNFSPRLQQAVRLLQMSSLDYAQALHEAAEANPFLEFEEAQATGEPDPDTFASEEPDWSEAATLDRLSSGISAPRAALSHDESADLLQRIPLPASLREHLHAQLGVLRLGEEDRMLAAAVVESLDDDGYLRISLQEIGAVVGESGDDDAAALHTALRRVQSLDPPGVGARSVSECLLLQLSTIEDPALRELARQIAADHLELLASRNLQRMATALGQPLSRVTAAAECIRKLNARPGWQYGEGTASFIIPDVIVRKRKGVWRAVLNDAAVPRVKLHQAYAQLFEQHRGSDDAQMSGCLERARWTLQNLAQRMSTIQAVAQEIVVKQKLFLDYGAMAMKPLGLREIADAVGVHPSTVSRTVHHKYMATPAGVFELKYFFSRGLAHGGGASAPTAVKELVRKLIAAEARHAPLSDAELARQLEQQGFRIARRTITKYRQALHIAPVERRSAA
jgi:RNA polymerase sigma-54 factor